MDNRESPNNRTPPEIASIKHKIAEVFRKKKLISMRLIVGDL